MENLTVDGSSPQNYFKMFYTFVVGCTWPKTFLYSHHLSATNVQIGTYDGYADQKSDENTMADFKTVSS